jgi:TRAP-type uncharacterized transport system substrate-binding protein
MSPVRSNSLIRYILAAFIAATTPLSGNRAEAAPSAESAIVNRGVVELEIGRAADVSTRMAEEIASIIDDGATRRVVPIVGKGPTQNLIDLKYLRGIDLAIVQTDALDLARDQQLVPAIASLTYIAKLYNQEFHLLARPDIKTIADLANKTLNIDVKGSGTSITAARVLGLLNIKATLTNENQGIALQKLRSGEIAALAFLAAKPDPFFASLERSDGLHFLNIPLTESLTAAYAPTRITASEYPGLVAANQPVDTIAVGNVLMAADVRTVPERYRNISNFIDTFFTAFPRLLEPGHAPKWQEVNISAEIPGWMRHPAAQQWLQRNSQIAAAPTAETMKALFARFIDERRHASGGSPMPAEDKDALFQQFQAWQRGLTH